MKRKVKIFAALVFCALFALSNSILVSACTAVYVGSEASEDGTILLAKSNDYQDVWGDYVAITERVENEPRRTMQVDNGFAVYGDNHELNLLDTYSGSEVVTNYSHLRTRVGHQLLSSSSYSDYHKEDKYPLCFTPDRKVSLQGVMELIRNRFEGTEYSPDETGRTDIRVINHDTGNARNPQDRGRYGRIRRKAVYNRLLQCHAGSGFYGCGTDSQ